jgi:hypothetical protein
MFSIVRLHHPGLRGSKELICTLAIHCPDASVTLLLKNDDVFYTLFHSISVIYTIMALAII